jgi:hypothetical protein
MGVVPIEGPLSAMGIAFPGWRLFEPASESYRGEDRDAKDEPVSTIDRFLHGVKRTIAKILDRQASIFLQCVEDNRGFDVLDGFVRQQNFVDEGR